ncbi:uncharacterized protein LOC132829638 isoform X2 [Hemiscyllium ocellatum]|uniref:uncharacterized protein LOC132829638 isoform X2 n=1 Tax=Hemiscyllium ocellatum TaxID=170820 RepID=UPI002965D486|nr:uncharacterized protein LOC132829638 isoform X2 [Hemiscyllium ocellatum]
MYKKYFWIISFFSCLTAAETGLCNPIQRRAGDSVTLPCKYTSRSYQNGFLDIEWALRSTNMNESDKLILTLSGGRVYVTDGWQQRITFLSSNGTKGDASLHFMALAVNDSGIYNCKVKAKDNQNATEVTSVPSTNQETQHELWTVQQNNTNTGENSTSPTKGDTNTSFHIIYVGIGFGISGFIIMLIVIITCLKHKPSAACLHRSRAVMNTAQQSEEFSFQGNLQNSTVRVSVEDIVYSIVQQTRKNNSTSTAHAQDQDIVHSKIQILNEVQNCNENIIYAPVLNKETASRLTQ